VAHAHDLQNGFVCVLCRPPSRAGKTRKLSSSDVADKQFDLSHGYMPPPLPSLQRITGHAKGGIA